MAFLNALVPGLLWLWAWAHLHYEWTLNAQYHFGWAVPFLAVFLFYLRWKDRPAPAPNAGPIAAALAWLILLSLAGLRWLEEANPDWRLLSWSLSLAVVAYSILSLYRVGGRAWATHFCFPVCFSLVAVPWPVQMENAIVHGLTRAVAAVAVEVAGWMGIGAYQLGNVIQLADGFVGVDEACSGVKTLQAAIMVSLFLGELLRCKLGQRVALLAFGSVWLFACNVVRATTLVVIAARSGIPALERWHDLIGSVVLVAGMAGLVGVALFLQRWIELADATANPGSGRHISVIETCAATLWLAAIFVGTESWYRSRERNLVVRPAWEARWPAGAKPAPIADTTAAILRYNTATSATWSDEAAEWWGFFARWKPGRAAVQLVRSHSPVVCLPAIGRTFVAELTPVEFREGDMQLRFRGYQFTQEGMPLFVFLCIQEDKQATDNSAHLEWNAGGRIRAALNGERNLGQRFLEVAVTNMPDEKKARDALGHVARQILRTNATD